MGLVLTACGGGGGASTTAATTTIEVTTADFSFAPTTWVVPAGRAITITLTNKGANDHEWVIIKYGEKVTVPFDADDEDRVYWEMEAAAGETKTETFTAPSQPGEYQIVCGLTGHIESGMEAKLIVK